MRHLRKVLRPSVLALLGPAVFACAGRTSAPDRSGVLLSDALSPEGRSGCDVAELPKQLPAAPAIVDAAGLERALAAAFPQGLPPHGVLFSIRFTQEGQVQWVEAIDGELPQAQPDQLQQLVIRTIRNQPAAGQPWSLRLQIVSGGIDALRVGRSETCPVERIMTSASRIAKGVATMSMDDLADLQRAGPFRVGVWVGASGQVLNIEMLQSSGSRIQDEMALKAARDGKYLPALVDGIPVAAQYEIRSRR